MKDFFVHIDLTHSIKLVANSKFLVLAKRLVGLSTNTEDSFVSDSVLNDEGAMVLAFALEDNATIKK